MKLINIFKNHMKEYSSLTSNFMNLEEKKTMRMLFFKMK